MVRVILNSPQVRAPKNEIKKWGFFGVILVPLLSFGPFQPQKTLNCSFVFFLDDKTPSLGIFFALDQQFEISYPAVQSPTPQLNYERCNRIFFIYGCRQYFIDFGTIFPLTFDFDEFLSPSGFDSGKISTHSLLVYVFPTI